MLGFHARASAGPVRLDGELEDARWFEFDELRSAPNVLLPPAYTIARRLIEAWFTQHAEQTRGV
jgi:NAD+ diphosphatase